MFLTGTDLILVSRFLIIFSKLLCYLLPSRTTIVLICHLSRTLYHYCMIWYFSVLRKIILSCSENKNQLRTMNLWLPGEGIVRELGIDMYTLLYLKWRDFSGCPVVRALPSSAGSAGSIPGLGAKIPHFSWPKSQNIKQKQYCNKFNKDFKNGPHQKKIFLNKIKWITTRTYCIAQGTLLCVMWRPGWEGSLGENRYMYMYD